MDGRDLGVRLVLERADSDASRELQNSFFADIAARYPGWDPGEGPSADPSEFRAPDGAWVVSYLDARPLGCGGVKAVDDETAEIRRVFLQKEARGRGIGRQLLQELEEHARRLGYRRVRLNTGDRQPEALGLFRSAGYVEIADFNGYAFAHHWMQKELQG